MHFRFPKGEKLTEWLEILGIGDDWQWSQNKFVCSKYFKESDFIKLGHKVFLKAEAVPNLQPLLKDMGMSRNNEVASISAHQECNPAEQVSTSTNDLSLLTTSTQSPSFSSIRTSSSDDTIHSGLRSKLKRHLI